MSVTNKNGLTAEQDAELKRLRAQHELYAIYAPQWNLYLAAYEGGPDFASEDNIFKHVRENNEDFNDRAKRLHYLNYCEPIVDFFTNFIFSETIDRDGGEQEKFFQEFIKNVDLKGTSIDTYMRQVCDDMQIFGMCYTLVDAPRAELLPGQVLTKQVENDQKIRPYWVLLRPSEITDWVVDDFEAFEYAKRRQLLSVVVSGEVRLIERYTEFFKDKIRITDVDITDKEKPQLASPVVLDNTLGKVPLYVHRFKRSKRYSFMGNSFLRDFAYNNREIMNLTSLLQEFLYRQCFNILAREVEAGIPLTSQEEGVLGTSNVMEIPKGAKMPEYLSPPADPAKFIQEERQLIKKEMFSRAAQEMGRELSNGEGASGFSQAQSFSRTVPFISSRADILEASENALFALTFERLSNEWKGRVKYKDRYEITNLTDAMTQFMTLTRDLGLPSEQFVKSELKRFVKEFDGKLAPEILTKIEKEVDGMSFDKWQELQEAALIGRQSPGEQQKPKGTGTMKEVESEARTPNTKSTKKLKDS